MGSGLQCPFKETSNAILTRAGAALFVHVGQVLGYTADFQVILHIRGEVEHLKMGGTWPVLTMGHPQSGSCTFVATGGYGGIMELVVHA
jgi:hypothetical protein